MKKMLALILMFTVLGDNNYFANWQAFFTKTPKQVSADIKKSSSEKSNVPDRMLELEQEIQSQIQACTMS